MLIPVLRCFRNLTYISFAGLVFFYFRSYAVPLQPEGLISMALLALSILDTLFLAKIKFIYRHSNLEIVENILQFIMAFILMLPWLESLPQALRWGYGSWSLLFVLLFLGPNAAVFVTQFRKVLPLKRKSEPVREIEEPKPEPRQSRRLEVVGSDLSKISLQRKREERPTIRVEELERPAVEESAVGKEKYCRYCGSKIPVDSIFCEACGKQLTSSTSP